MEILKGTVLSKYLLEKYARNPKGWSFTISPANKDAFFDALVSSPEENWQLKIESIFKPSPVILGAKVEGKVRNQGAPASLPSYGYRKLDPEALLKLLNEEGEEEPSLSQLISSIEPTAPLPGASYAQGPFVFANQKFAGLSDNQKKLDERLGSELKNLMREKYLSYG